jgi:hypothetical protein
MARYDIPDPAWEIILPYLSIEHSQRIGHRYLEHCRIINGMFWWEHHGGIYPERYSPRKTVDNHLTDG